LRGGVKFVDYLIKYNYYGTDISEDLIKKGITYLDELGLKDKVNNGSFIANGNFDFKKFNIKFKYVLAQSVFTHLKINKLKLMP